MIRHAPAGLFVLCALVGCAEPEPERGRAAEAVTEGSGDGTQPLGDDGACDASALPYATEVVAFTPGEGAGFGADGMPDVVLGPPGGGSPTSGSLDVVSLGAGGTLVLGFGDRAIVDGPGADFVVFENAFYIGASSDVFQELLEVAVSADGERWFPFACVPDLDAPATWSGCAGHTPRAAYHACDAPMLDPAVTGGDAFDLADVGLDRARYVRLRDIQGEGASPSQGADIDAVGLVHFESVAPPSGR